MRRITGQNARERGSALIEFLLSAIFWVPLLLGVIFLGINITRSIAVAEICRDAGHMYAYGVDFSQTANQNVLVRLASEFNLNSNGNGVVMFSNVHLVSDQDCEGAGLAADTSDCQNLSQYVFTQRLTIGNSSLRASDFGAPKAGMADSSGNLNPNYYLHDSTARVSGFDTVLALQPGQSAFLTEAFFSAPDLDWSGFLSGSGTYSRAIF